MLRPRQLLATSIQRRQIATSAPRVPVLRIYAQRCASSAASAAPALSDSAPSLELVPPSSSLSSTSIESVLTFEPTELTSQFGESHSRFVAAPKLSRIASPNSSTPSERSAQAVDNSTTTTTITSTSPDANTATYPAPGQDPYTIPFEAESSPPTPVTAEEFLYLLTKICPNNIVPYRIGLAISGGVDSMALAFLVKKIADLGFIEHKNVIALVVDHGVREGSAQEAWEVEELLKSYGFTTLVLPLIPPPNSPPISAVPKHTFESTARIYRYHLFARACLAHEVSHLLLAHHLDDQAETILMRIAAGTGYAGTAGMKPIIKMPHVNSVRGAVGAINVLRPFLVDGWRGRGVEGQEGGMGVWKERLVETCVANGIRWWEDSTNHVWSYTRRNAVRWLLRGEGDRRLKEKVKGRPKGKEQGREENAMTLEGNAVEGEIEEKEGNGGDRAAVKERKKSEAVAKSIQDEDNTLMDDLKWQVSRTTVEGNSRSPSEALCRAAPYSSRVSPTPCASSKPIHRLPHALSRTSLVLFAWRMTHRIYFEDDAIATQLQSLGGAKLEVCTFSSVARLTLPRWSSAYVPSRLTATTTTTSPFSSPPTRDRLRLPPGGPGEVSALARLLGKVCELVTSSDRVDTGVLRELAVPSIFFPGVEDLARARGGKGMLDKAAEPKTFTACSIMWTPERISVDRVTWVLSRMPVKRNARAVEMVFSPPVPAPSPPNLMVEGTGEAGPMGETTKALLTYMPEEWRLFDGRFFMRRRPVAIVIAGSENPHAHLPPPSDNAPWKLASRPPTIRVRLLQLSEMSALKSRLCGQDAYTLFIPTQAALYRPVLDPEQLFAAQQTQAGVHAHIYDYDTADPEAGPQPYVPTKGFLPAVLLAPHLAMRFLSSVLKKVPGYARPQIPLAVDASTGQILGLPSLGLWRGETVGWDGGTSTDWTKWRGTGGIVECIVRGRGEFVGEDREGAGLGKGWNVRWVWVGKVKGGKVVV